MLDYAAKLTKAPSSITEEDVKSLLKVGYNEREVSDGVQVISYFNYINRVAEGLGVGK